MVFAPSSFIHTQKKKNSRHDVGNRRSCHWSNTFLSSHHYNVLARKKSLDPIISSRTAGRTQFHCLQTHRGSRKRIVITQTLCGHINMYSQVSRAHNNIHIFDVYIMRHEPRAKLAEAYAEVCGGVRIRACGPARLAYSWYRTKAHDFNIMMKL